MRIRKAILPAAGLGTRFLPATKAQPKEMLPVFDKPAIQYTVEEAAASGIEEILIITGRGKQAIENHFDRNFELEYFLKQKEQNELLRKLRQIDMKINMFYVRQKEPLGLGHAILCGKSFIEEGEPFAVFLADDLIVSRKPAMAQLMKVWERTQEPVIAVEKVPTNKLSSYGIIDPIRVFDRVWKVRDMVEKPTRKSAPSHLGIVGRYILTQDIFGILEETRRGRGGEIQLTDGLRELRRRRSIYACEFEGVRYDLGNKLDYTKATLEFAMADPEVRLPLVRYLRSKMK